MKWKVCILGGLFCIVGLILYCCAVAAGRADQKLKDDILSFKPEEGLDDLWESWDSIHMREDNEQG